MTDRTEARSADLWPGVELRAAPDGFTFEGYAAVFDTPSVRMAFPGVNGGQPFREVVHRGAFAKTLAEAPVIRLLWQHDDSTLPLASTRNGSLTLSEDERGLRVSGTLPDDEWGRPVRNAIADGRIAGMSFRFQKVIDKFTKDAGEAVRHLHEVRLVHEVSVTDNPAYPATAAAVRSAGPVTANEPVIWLTADDIRALHLEGRAASSKGVPNNTCCEACDMGSTMDCCAMGECPSGCTGCRVCEDGNPPFGDLTDMADQMNSAAADAASKLAEKRARLDAIR